MPKWIKIISTFSLITVLTACGGSGSDFDSTDTLSEADIEQIRLQVESFELGDLSALTQVEIDQITENLQSSGLSTNDIASVFSALNIGLASSVNSGKLIPGFWEDTINYQYIHIAGDSVVYYQLKDRCYIADLYTIKGISDDQLSLLNNETQAITSVSFNLVNNELFSTTFPEGSQGDFSWYVRPSPNSTTGCETTKNIEIEISYRELPSQLRVDDAFYRWSIYFDINKNKILDSGDIRASVGDNSLRGYDVLDMVDLTPQIWVTSSTESGINHVTVDKAVPFGINNNVIKLTIDDSYQSLIRFIDSDTPMYAEAVLNYTGTDHSVFGTNDVNQDGPWNWSTPIMLHSDRFPDSGYVDVDNGVTYTDNLNDQVGESGWIDIDTVKVTITDL